MGQAASIAKMDQEFSPPPRCVNLRPAESQASQGIEDATPPPSYISADPEKEQFDAGVKDEASSCIETATPRTSCMSSDSGSTPWSNDPSEENAELADALTLQTCLICYEEKDDVAVLDHWQPQGDVSEHKMCGACRASAVRNECPFCKEILAKEEILAFISDFVKSLSSQAKTRGHAAHECAALFEMWQFFEMQYEGQPGVIQRVAKMIVEDAVFGVLLEQAATTRQSWVHESAGIFFRFHGMYADGELKIGEAHGRLLEQAVEQILSPLEKSPPQASFLPRTGTPLGAVVTQALVAWLCAWRADAATRTLRSTVRRAGLAAVHCYEAYNRNPTIAVGARERIHLEYLSLNHVPIWGSQEQDVVWQAFFAHRGKRDAGRTGGGIHCYF